MVADIGELVEAVRDELNAPDANVILWGTGYGASLATWARREFPEEIQGMNISKTEVQIPMTYAIHFQVFGHQVEYLNKVY